MSQIPASCHPCFHVHTHYISNPQPQSSYASRISARIQLDNHVQCDCSQYKDNNLNQLNQSDVISGLLKHNSSLTKYLSKYYKDDDQKIPQNIDIHEDDVIKGRRIDNYVSIVEQKNLNFGIPDDTKLPQKQKEEQFEQQQKPMLMETAQQTSPKAQKNKKKSHDIPQYLNGDQKKIDQYYKQLKKQSRYLSDTGFRKHFNRQCFENYGRENTTGVADGIMYGNYLKTFNINPHCGANLPQKQQTYGHSLVSASPNKYTDYKKIIKKSPQAQRLHQMNICDQQTINPASKQCQQLTHQNLVKQQYKMQQTIRQNQEYHRQQNKYNNLKLVNRNRHQQQWQEEQRPMIPHQKQTQFKQIQQRQYQRQHENQEKQRKYAMRQNFPEQNIQTQNKDRIANNRNLSEPQLSPISPKNIKNPINNKINTKNQNKKSYQQIIYKSPIVQKKSQQRSYHNYSANCFYSTEFADDFRNYVINRSFQDPLLVRQILKYAQNFNCQICKHRKYTKCCCRIQ